MYELIFRYAKKKISHGIDHFLTKDSNGKKNEKKIQTVQLLLKKHSLNFHNKNK
jgi:hypothetical protein